MTNWITSVVNLVPTVIGILQSVLPPLKELAIAIVRLVAVLPFLWRTTEPMIKKVNNVYGVINRWIERVKNWMLVINR